MLAGKVAVITGANGGLGRFVTKAFLDAGATVTGVSRSIQDSDFPQPGFSALAVELNSGDAAGHIVAAVIARHPRLDILVHLMGGFAGGQSVPETSDETLDRMLDINFRSAFWMTRAALAVMGDGGRILAIGSRAAIEPPAGVSAYSASKAALIALILTIAQENKPRGVTANVILPTTLNPQISASVASLAVWLASDGASQVSGAAIPVYGAEL